MILDTGRTWFRKISETSAGSTRNRRRSRRWSSNQALEPLETRNLLSTITGTQVTEGDTTMNEAVFKIVLARPSARRLEYRAVTGGGIATPQEDGATNPDYIPYDSKKPVVFEPGMMEREVRVKIIGDRLVEHDENFFLVVRGNGQIAFGEAIIIDDDPNPGPPLHVSNTSVEEGTTPVVIMPPTDPVTPVPIPTTPTLPDGTTPLPNPLALRRLRRPTLSPLAARWAARMRPSLQ